MVSVKSSAKRTANILYNNVTQIPFSVIKGVGWIYCLPSHINVQAKMDEYGVRTNIEPDMPSHSPFFQIDEQRLNSTIPSLKDHYYFKLSGLGEGLMRGESSLEMCLTDVPRHFVSLFSGIGLGIGGTLALISQYGAKGAIPLAVSTGLSLIHELNFNRYLKAKN